MMEIFEALMAEVFWIYLFFVVIGVIGLAFFYAGEYVVRMIWSR